MASKRRNMFHKNKTQETTEEGRIIGNRHQQPADMRSEEDVCSKTQDETSTKRVHVSIGQGAGHGQQEDYQRNRGVWEEHTLVHSGVTRDLGWSDGVTPCGCRATTVAGVTPMGGKLEIDLEPISGVKRTVLAHVLDWGPQNYQIILGADALCLLGARVAPQVRDIGESSWESVNTKPSN
ncbi:hypothetical protein AAG570_010959 [Ranatra chinensis]|uniref:Uncharacterized protein n=1 Tax=Ranatra chinensis TaxID=642074 RepID=A0ABD0YJ74_9HEMI